MANRYFNPNAQYLDSSGDPLSGGLLYFYVTGTTTPTDTYNAEDLLTANANPVVLDSLGRAGDIFLDPDVTYKAVLKTSAGVTIWTADPVVDPAANVTASVQVYAGDPNGNVAGNAGTPGGTGASVAYDTTNDLLYVCTTTGTASTAVWTQVAADITGAFTTSGVTSPASFSTQQDDYTPSGLSSTSILRLTTGADSDVTGLAGGAAGRHIWIFNIGSNLITLKAEDSNSSAANRFDLPGDLNILPDNCVELVYDGTSSRWRVASGPHEPLGRINRVHTATDNYTATLRDMLGGMIEMNNAAAKAITIPTNAAVTTPAWAYFNFVQIGAGTLTVVGDTGVTVNGVSAGTVTVSAQYGGGLAYRKGSDNWIIPNFTAA